MFGFSILIFSQDDEKLAYRRLKLLGQGSFGKAFLARDLSNNDLVVMKQVRCEYDTRLVVRSEGCIVYACYIDFLCSCILFYLYFKQH